MRSRRWSGCGGVSFVFSSRGLRISWGGLCAAVGVEMPVLRIGTLSILIPQCIATDTGDHAGPTPTSARTPSSHPLRKSFTFCTCNRSRAFCSDFGLSRTFSFPFGGTVLTLQLLCFFILFVGSKLQFLEANDHLEF